jgi:hypothetical protein
MLNSKARIFHAAFFTPTARGMGLPMLAWGKPGSAKTSQFRQFAKKFAAPIEVLSPGSKGEGAFGVIAVPDNGFLTFPRHEWTKKMGDYGLLFLDELTTAPPAIQPALLELALEGTVGAHTLAPGVRIWAAANPVECSANGYELAAPQANRFVHFDWTVSAQEVAAYFRTGLLGRQGPNDAPIDPVAEEVRVMALWDDIFAASTHRFAAFLDARPDLAERMPPEGDPNRSKAWPSPRSWEMAARCEASGRIHGLTQEEVDTLGAGCVGESAWQEYCDFIAAQDLPDPAALLDGAIQWAPDSKRLDITSAVINAAVSLVTPKDAPKRIARSGALWALLSQVGKAGARDVTHGPAQAMIKAGLLTHPNAIAVMADMRASGFVEALK